MIKREGEKAWIGYNVIVDVIKLILLIYYNFIIVKKVVNKIERVK